MVWNTETTEFQMKGVAYTGNNMRKLMSLSADHHTTLKCGMKLIYHSYSGKKTDRQRIRSSNVPRPSGLIPPKSSARRI